MKYFITVLLLVIPFSSLVKADILEPEEHSDITFAKRDSTYDFIEHNGLVYTIADDGIHGLELWVFDEKLNSLRMVKDINPNGDANPLVISNDLEKGLLFYANDGNGTGLWLTDGTELGTRLLHYYYYPQLYSAVERNYWGGSVVFKGDYYFYASDLDIQDSELWKTDGTEEGTVLVKEINPNGASLPSDFHTIGGRLLFRTYRGPRDIWSTDGTAENTINLTNNINKLKPTIILGWNSTHDYFLDSLDGSLELWSTDGTVEGTLPLTNNFEDSYLGFSNYMYIGNNFYFVGHTKSKDKRLIVTDGSQEGTKELLLFTNFKNSNFYLFSYSKNDNEIKFFIRDYGENSLWVTDGTEQGTIRLTPTEITRISDLKSSENSDKLFFVTFDEIKGEDLWVSDGTEEGTKFVKNLSVGGDRPRIEFSTEIVNDKVLYLYENEKSVKSIWITDGTEAGTYILNNDLRYQDRMFLFESVLNNKLYFREIGADNTVRLWQTDMTEEGTNIIMPKDQKNDIHVYPFYSFQIEYKNSVYFFADYYGEGQQLYRIPNTISSVEDTPQPELMTVYPNPAKDFIQLELSKPMQLSIINSTGAKVKDYGIVDNGKLNVAELHSGVYFVVDEQGKNIAKFVKE